MPDARGEPTRARDRIEHGLRRLACVFTVWSYTALSPFGAAGFVLLYFLWRRDPLDRARRLQAVTVRAYRFMHHWLRVWNITNFDPRWSVEGIPEGPCVVIANHPTLMDITSISAVVGGGCTIVKPQMYRRRFMHTLLVGAGHLEGPGRDVVSIGEVVEAAVERLGQGFRLIVFPEGTRSRPDGLLPFSRTPFEIACRAGVPVVSLKIRCDPVYLSKEVPVYRPPQPTPQLRLGLLAVDDPASVDGDSRELRRRVESRYRDWWEASIAHRSSPRTNEHDTHPTTSPWKRRTSRSRIG